jgi:hypothetical protein
MELKGFINAVVFSLIFFIGNTQQPLTPRYIFDFEPGDLFHYHTSDYGNFIYYGGFSIKILGKLVSAGNDSVTYYIKKNNYSQAMNQNTGQFTDTIYTTLIDTITYTNLDTDVALLPQYNAATFQDFQNYYNYYASLDSSCLFGMNFQDTLNNWDLNGVLTPSYYANYDVSPSSCNNFVSRTYSNRFGEGLGTISFYHSVSGGPFYGSSKSMVYFKKDTIESGIPDVFLSDAEDIPVVEFKLYPNPSSEIVYIEMSSFPQKEYTVRLLNPYGQLMEQRSLSAMLHEWDVRHFPSGLLFYQVCDGANILRQGRFLVAR